VPSSDHGKGRGWLDGAGGAYLEGGKARSGPQAPRDFGGERLLVCDVHLNVHRVGGVEVGAVEGGDVAADEADLVVEACRPGQGLGSVYVGGCDVDADDGAAGAPGDLACGAAESRADIEHRHSWCQVQAGQELVHGLGSAAVELVDLVSLGLGQRGEIPFSQTLDRGDKVSFGIGHGRRSLSEGGPARSGRSIRAEF
jgi:hypothetical protein